MERTRERERGKKGSPQLAESCTVIYRIAAVNAYIASVVRAGKKSFNDVVVCVTLLAVCVCVKVFEFDSAGTSPTNGRVLSKESRREKEAEKAKYKP